MLIYSLFFPFIAINVTNLDVIKIIIFLNLITIIDSSSTPYIYYVEII